MTWAQFVKSYAWAHHITVVQARKLLDQIFVHVAQVTIDEGELRIAGFGVFRRRTRRARRILSPVDGSEIQLPATTEVRFRKSRRFGGAR